MAYSPSLFATRTGGIFGSVSTVVATWLAWNPEATSAPGDVRLGQRQVRRGKSGAVRVYYLDLPHRAVTHLVAIFGRREKSDLSPAERRAVAELVKQLKEEKS